MNWKTDTFLVLSSVALGSVFGGAIGGFVGFFVGALAGFIVSLFVGADDPHDPTIDSHN